MAFDIQSLLDFSSLNGILLAIGAVLLIVGLFKLGKSKSVGRTFLWIGGGLLAVTLVLPMLGVNLLGDGGLDLGGIFGGQAQPAVVVNTGGGNSNAGVVCAVEDTTVTLSAVNKFTQAAASGTHRYRVNGNAPLTVSDTGTFTASPGDSVEVLWENAATDAGYYSDVVTFAVPCKGTYPITGELYQNGTLTVQVYNEEGNVIDSAGENETLAAGDTVTLPIKLTGQFQRGIPFGMIVVAEWNNTEVDDVIVNLGGSAVAVPSIHTLSSTSNKAKAYVVPAISSNQILEGTVYIDADDSVNPASASDILLKFYPNAYFKNEDNGANVGGPAVEDEDNTATYGASYSSTVQID